MDQVNFIFVYTRADAIADGILVDATDMTRHMGIRIPVAFTSTLWEHVVQPHAVDASLGQTVNSRLRMVMDAFRQFAGNAVGQEVLFPLLTVVDRQLVEVQIKAHIGPGDNAEPVLTFMFPTED